MFGYVSMGYDDAPEQLRPALRVRMTHKTSGEFLALVDTGATYPVLPRSIADEIGIGDEGVSALIRQASGNSNVLETTVDSIEILRDGGRVFDVLRGQRVLVMESDIPFCILGRESVFKRFDVTFSEKRKEMILTRV